jgi:hypothetical protein
MAYIPYGQNTTGGKQLSELMADLIGAADKLRDITAWILEIGPTAIEANADFSVGNGNAQGFSDTVAQINADMLTFMDTNREKIARLARGS